MTFDVDALRAQFPALNRHAPDGHLPIFFDNPAGTQVPQIVINAYRDYFTRMNANSGGYFRTSQLSDMMTAQVRESVAGFLNAPRADEIVFGANMTSLCFALSRSLAKTLQSGDEIVLTRMDHDANVTPWTLIAEDVGLTVRWVDINPEDATLDLNSLEAALTDRTKIVATVHASNAVGTINPVARIAEMAHAAGAYFIVDAVQSAPHVPLDVQAMGCDFLLCSAYKFFGPHLGIMWGKYDLLADLPAYKVRPAKDKPPHRWETGTANFESINATGAAIAYLGQIGRDFGGDYADSFPGFSGDRLTYKLGMEALRLYEKSLVTALIDELKATNGVTIYGITDPKRYDDRCPTVVFAHDDYTPAQIAERLARQHIYVWSGHYYAIEIMDALERAQDGLLRVGLAHYNTLDEVHRFARILRTIVRE